MDRLPILDQAISHYTRPDNDVSATNNHLLKDIPEENESTMHHNLLTGIDFLREIALCLVLEKLSCIISFPDTIKERITTGMNLLYQSDIAFHYLAPGQTGSQFVELLADKVLESDELDTHDFVQIGKLIWTHNHEGYTILELLQTWRDWDAVSIETDFMKLGLYQQALVIGKIPAKCTGRNKLYTTYLRRFHDMKRTSFGLSPLWDLDD